MPITCCILFHCHFISLFCCWTSRWFSVCCCYRHSCCFSPVSSTSCVQDFQGISMRVNCWVIGCFDGHFYSVLPHCTPKWSYQFAHSPAVDEGCFPTSQTHFILSDWSLYSLMWQLCPVYIPDVNAGSEASAQPFLTIFHLSWDIASSYKKASLTCLSWLGSLPDHSPHSPVCFPITALGIWVVTAFSTRLSSPRQGPWLQGHWAGCREHEGATEHAPRRHISSTQNKGLLFLIPTKCPLMMAAVHITWHLGPQEPTTWPMVFISIWLLPTDHGSLEARTYLLFCHCCALYKVGVH